MSSMARSGHRPHRQQTDLAEWFEGFWREKLPPNGEADLFDQFGIDGDDASEFIDSFTKHFAVDASEYRWYFHHGEEGWNLAGLFFAPPYRRVTRLPITPDILVTAIKTRRWPLQYPDHSLPSVRWDVRANVMLLVVLPLALAALWLWQRLVR